MSAFFLDHGRACRVMLDTGLIEKANGRVHGPWTTVPWLERPRLEEHDLTVPRTDNPVGVGKFAVDGGIAAIVARP